MSMKNLAGKIFGRLTAISLEPDGIMLDSGGRPHPRRRLWICACACGTEVKVRPDRLLSGKTRSCGCLRDDIRNAPRAEREVLVAQSAAAKIAIIAQQHFHEFIPPLPAKIGADRHHKLPHGTYASLFDAQGGRCFICRAEPPIGTPLHLDHDHATQQVRGLLCNACNTGLGCFKDNAQLLARAIEYLNIERPVILSSQTAGRDADEARRQAYREQLAAWEATRKEKAAAKAVKKAEREARSAELTALKIEREVRRQEKAAKRKAAADESRREWSAIEEEREAARIARRDLKRATRAAAKELAEIKRQQQEILAPEREARWGTEFELIVDPVPDYGQKPAKGFGAVQKV